MTRWLRALDRRPVAELVVVGAYVLAAAWAAWVVGHPDDLTLWYPPPGVAVAAVAVGGRRFVLPAVLAEAIVAVLVFDLVPDLGAGLTVVHVVAVGGSYAAVGLVLRALRIDPRLPDLRHVALLGGVLLAGAVPAAVAGTTVQRVADVLDESHLSEATTWFKIDALGMLVLVPAIVLAVAPRGRTGGPVPRPPLRTRLGTAEVVSVLALPVVAVALVEEIDVLYLVLAPVLLVAWRRGQPGASVAAAATAAVLATTLALADTAVARRDAVALVALVAATGLLGALAAADRFRLARRHDHLVTTLERTDEVVVPDLDEHLAVAGHTLFARRVNGRVEEPRDGERHPPVESLLRDIIDDHALPLHFRPVVDLETGELVGAEALLRVRHDDLGPVDPSEVRGVAREAGLLGELDHLTVQTAAAIAATWPSGVSVSVDVSPDRLGDDTWYRVVADALHSSGLSPERLVLEVAEEAFDDDPGPAIEELRRCRRLGVRVALDDFGAGRSSLATLRAVPVDMLKLDPSLLAELGGSGPARAIAGAVLGVAEVLELTVVAAGIDSDEQLATARSLGCRLGQGDRLARPAPADALEAFRVPAG